MKILVIDVETLPHLSFHWGRWQQNIRPEMTESESRICCFAAQWLGKKKMIFHSEWGTGREGMLAAL